LGDGWPNLGPIARQFYRREKYFGGDRGERRVRELYRRDHDKYGPMSLDVPIFGDSAVTLGETITTGLWQ
jgi:hypothetical protein